MYVDRGRELGVFKPPSSERSPITANGFNKLGEHLLQKIQAAVERGTLGDAPFYFDITRAWAHLGDAADAKAWLANGMWESAAFMAKMGRGLVSYTIGTKDKVYTMREPPEPELYDLSDLIAETPRRIRTRPRPKKLDIRDRKWIGALVDGWG